ncbi:MAG: DnaJ domain-containing protein [Chloroflexota bacterium]
MKDYYTILDLPPNATDEQIRTQYRQLVRIYHPDRFSNATDRTYAERKLMEINEAYYALLAPERTGKGPNRRLAYSEARFPLISSTPGSVMILLSVLFFGVFLGRTDYTQLSDANSSEPNPSIWQRLTSVWASSDLENGSADPVHNWLSFSVFENYQNVLYVIDEEGQKRMNLSLPGHHPVWSPNRDHIAFLSPDRTGEQIYTARAIMTDESPIRSRSGIAEGRDKLIQNTDDADGKRQIAWAPDGLKVAYLATNIEDLSLSGSSQTSIVKLIDLTSSEVTSLTNAQFGFASYVTWLDNQTLLVDVEAEGDSRTYQLALNGDAVVPLTYFSSRHPSVSPDGQQIAVASDEGVFTLDRNGENLTQLTEKPAWFPVWDKTGNRIAHLSTVNASTGDRDDVTSDELRLTADLWITDIDSQNTVRITESGCLEFAWSGDGQTLAYVTGSLQTQSPTLYLWTVKAGADPKLIAEISHPHIAWGRDS